MGAAATNFIIVVKRDCPTCVMVEPVIAQAESAGASLQVWCQDDPTFPSTVSSVGDDRQLEHSWRWKIETVPTLIQLDNEAEVERTVGWDRDEWQRLLRLDTLPDDLPAFRPGCGSMSVGPGMSETLALRFVVAARRSGRSGRPRRGLL